MYDHFNLYKKYEMILRIKNVIHKGLILIKQILYIKINVYS